MSCSQSLIQHLKTAACAVAVIGWLAATTACAADAAKPDAHASAHDDHGDHSAAHGNSDPLSFDPDLAIWTVVVFLVLLGVLRKFAWGPIVAGLERREKMIADHIAAAEQSHADAQRLLAEYEGRIAKAHDEVRALLDEARRDAEHTQQDIVAKAKVDAEAELARAKREIETAKDQALITLAESAANQAVDLAGKILGAKLNPAEHISLIDKALTGLPNRN